MNLTCGFAVAGGQAAAVATAVSVTVQIIQQSVFAYNDITTTTVTLPESAAAASVDVGTDRVAGVADDGGDVDVDVDVEGGVRIVDASFSSCTRGTGFIGPCSQQGRYFIRHPNTVSTCSSCSS